MGNLANHMLFRLNNGAALKEYFEPQPQLSFVGVVLTQYIGGGVSLTITAFYRHRFGMLEYLLFVRIPSPNQFHIVIKQESVYKYQI